MFHQGKIVVCCQGLVGSREKTIMGMGKQLGLGWDLKSGPSLNNNTIQPTISDRITALQSGNIQELYQTAMSCNWQLTIYQQ